MTSVRATPFHGRAAASNTMNLWRPRAGWTLAESYDDAGEEALAARLTCAMADITWRWRVMIEGTRAQEFLSRLMTRDPSALGVAEAYVAGSGAGVSAHDLVDPPPVGGDLVRRGLARPVGLGERLDVDVDASQLRNRVVDRRRGAPGRGQGHAAGQRVA